jgi:hypothetical protein
MARPYANENFPQPVVAELRRLGHDVPTVVETGRASQAWPDSEVLKFACEERRAVLTLNRRHFVRPHEERPGHCGIVVCTFDLDYAGQASRIDGAIKSQLRLTNQLIRINRPN